MNTQNFIKPEVAKLKLDTAFNRFASRFKRVEDWFGNIIIDSSAAESGSFVDEFIENRCDPKKTKVVRPKIWEVKVNDYGYEGWFQVYLGDSTRDPFIINVENSEDYVTPLDLDPDRILDVPRELFTEFRLNLELSLNDHAGISTTSNDFFIQDRKSLDKVFTLPLKNQEVIELDFYSKDKIISALRRSLDEIPKDRVLAVRFDIGVVSDYTGLSICYFDDYIVMDKKNKTRKPKFVNAVNAAIGRISGQETSITKLYQFVKDLSKEWEIGAVTCDSFQSRQLLQDLERDGFNAYMLSVDRTDEAYQTLKLAIYEERIKIVQSKLLQRELRELQYSRKNGRGKVDHPESTSSDTLTYGKGSKDCADGLAGAIQSMESDLEIFTNLSKLYVRESYAIHMKKKAASSKKLLERDIRKITRSGGYEKFLKTESERQELFANPNIPLPTTKRKKYYK